MTLLPVYPVPSWHVISRSLNFTFTNKTFVTDVVRYLEKLNIKENCVNNTSNSVNNFKMEKEYLS